MGGVVNSVELFDDYKPWNDVETIDTTDENFYEDFTKHYSTRSYMRNIFGTYAAGGGWSAYELAEKVYYWD